MTIENSDTNNPLKAETLSPDLEKEMPLEEEISGPEPAAIAPEVALQEENARLKDQLLRSMAEMENLRKRSQRDKEETRQYAITNFARELLSVADNLNRALETLTAETGEMTASMKSLMDGIQLTQRELEAIFTRQGIQKVSPLGTKFDHNFHQAMFEAENTEYAPGIVSQVLQEGYMIQDRLLRPAMVGVAK